MGEVYRAVDGRLGREVAINFTVWMAGGGVKAGVEYGRTDDYGYNITDADG